MKVPRLRYMRERAGLTQAELAEKIGAGRRSVISWEQGYGIRPATARKAAQALGVEVADLYEEAGSGKASALSRPAVRTWLRERGAGRFAEDDEEWARRGRDRGADKSLDVILEELRAHAREYAAFRDAISVAPSKLPEAVRDRRKDLKREVSRSYNRRFITLVNAGNALIADTFESPELEHEVSRWASAAAHEQQRDGCLAKPPRASRG